MEGAQNVIVELENILRAADEEYNLLIQGAKDVCGFHNSTPVQNKSQVPIIEIQDQTSENLQQLEQKMAIGELTIEKALLQKELILLNLRKERLRSKLNNLKRKCEYDNQVLAAENKEINGKTIPEKDVKRNQKEINKLKVELESLGPLESPLYVLSRIEVSDDLRVQLSDLRKKASQFLDLPPDYRQAREKLAEVAKEETELSAKIAKLLSGT